jgi:thioredoxin-related protein
MRYLLLFLILGFGLLCQAQDSSSLSGDTIAIRDTVIFSNLDFDAFKKQARFENKPYFIMFSASWCAPCHRIKTELFTNQQIAGLSNQNYLAYYMDLESFDGAEINSKLFKVSQLPTVLFFDPRGGETDRAIGYFDGYYFFRKLRAHIPPAKWGRDWGEGSE